MRTTVRRTRGRLGSYGDGAAGPVRGAGGLVVVGWDIRPQGVQGQLRVVGGHAGDLQKALTAMLETVSEAAQAA
ncbi:DUF6507 family protein, partial [Streptomyces sp. NPDC056099]